MFGAMSNPKAAYGKVGLETKVATASPHELVMMLFDGAMTSILLARMYLEQRAIKEKGEAIGRAIDIIDGGLKASLDHSVGGDLSVHLASLYEYMCTRLLLANLRNDPVILDEVSGLLGELRGAWAEIGKDPAINYAKRAAA
jgi:flagellar protein FliS